MERQIPPARLLGILVVRRLLMIWLDILGYWASKWVNPMASVPVELLSRGEFLAKNVELQERLRQVFAPFYHLCKQSCCCRSEEVFTELPRYGAVDSVLYGIYPDSVRSISPFALSKLPKSVFRQQADLMISYFKQFILERTDDPQGEEQVEKPLFPCPALTEEGCSLAWGRRPVICMSFVCGKFLRAMDWRERWSAAWIVSRYLLHLTLSLRLVVAEWRHQQGMYALRTRSGTVKMTAPY